jgi:PAS domain S-box-containing protein
MEVLYAAPDPEPLWPQDAPMMDATVEWLDSLVAVTERLGAGEVDCLVVDPAFADGDLLGTLTSVRAADPDVPFVVYGSGVADETVRTLFEEAGTDYVVRDGTSGGLALARRLTDYAAPADAGTPTEQHASLTVCLDGEVRFASGDTTALFGASPSDLAGRELASLLGASDAEALLSAGSGRTRTVSLTDGTDAEVSVRRTPTGERATLAFQRDSGSGDESPPVSSASASAAADTTAESAPDPAATADDDATTVVVDESAGSESTGTNAPPPEPSSESAPGSTPERDAEAVFERVADAVFALDTDWRFTYCNEQAEALLGYEADDLVGTSIWTTFAEARDSTFQREYERAMRDQEQVSFTEYYPPLEMWFQVVAYPSETGLSVYFRDVTEATQNAAARRAVDSLTRSLRDATSLEDGMAAAVDAVVEETDWSYGEAWRVVGDDLVQTEAWCHRPVAAVAGETSLSTIRAGLADLSVDDEFVAQTLEAGTLARTSLSEAGLETAIAVPVVYEGSAVAVLVFGLHVARENVTRLVEAARTAATELGSLADRLEAWRELSRRTRQFEAVFQDPETPVALLDTDGTIRRHNDTGLAMADTEGTGSVGTFYWDLPYWDGTGLSETTVRGFVSRAADGEYVQFETVNPDVDGELKAFDTSIRPVSDGEGGVEALVVESRDVSDRVRADADRERKERLFDAVFADPANGILLLDAEGTIVRANEVSLRSYDGEDTLVGLPYWEHPWWPEAERSTADVRSYVERVANGEFVRFETVNEGGPDDRVAIDVSLRPVHGEDGDVVGMVAQGLDVSAQHRLERDLREERNLTRRILETSPVGIAIVTAEGEAEYLNARAVELIGPAEDLPADSMTLTTPDGDRIPDEERPFRRVLRSDEPLFGMVVGLEVDDETLWLSINGARIGDGERAVMTFEDVTEQRTRTEQLATLATTTQALPDAESPTDVAIAALTAAAAVLGTESVAIALTDPSGDRLELVAGSDDSLRCHVAAESTGAAAEDDATPLGWRVFQEGAAATEAGVIALPLGSHGVFLADVASGLEATTRRLADLFAANVTAELRRADREAALRDRSEELASRTAALERLNRVNDVIRTMTASLLDADSREEVEAAACEAFAAATPYRLAWVGHRRPGSDHLELAVSTGAEGATADGVDRLVGLGDSPATRAVESGAVVVVDDLLSAGPDDGVPSAWHTFGAERDLRACASVPIGRNETRYGVLTLFASEPAGFGTLEREVLAELGEMMGYAIASLERRQALASDRATELVFSFPVADLRLFPFLRNESISMTIQNIVPRGDGRAHLFFSVEGVAPETVLEMTRAAPGTDRISRIDDGADEAPHFEAVLAAGSPTARLLERGFVVHDCEVVGDSLHLTIRAAIDADPREVLSEFQTVYDRVELVSKHDLPEPVRNAGSVETAYLETLTRRQEEVLRTAHAAGFFEWPRVNSGQDVAGLLGVSQPTVNRHLREAERKLFDQLFGAR